MVIDETFTISVVWFKDYQHNNRTSLRENQAQIQLTYTILIEKLSSNFFYT